MAAATGAYLALHHLGVVFIAIVGRSAAPHALDALHHGWQA